MGFSEEEKKNGCKGENEFTAEGKGLTFETERTRIKEAVPKNVYDSRDVISLFYSLINGQELLPFFPFYFGRRKYKMDKINNNGI